MSASRRDYVALGAGGERPNNNSDDDLYVVNGARKFPFYVRVVMIFVVLASIGGAVALAIVLSSTSSSPAASPPPSNVPTPAPSPPQPYVPPRCDHPVYCVGPLLQAVQLSEPPLYNDSKTFVDQPILTSPTQVLAAFAKLQAKSAGSPNATIPTHVLREFVNANFDAAGAEVVSFVPDDFDPNPPFLALINNAVLRNFSQQVHLKWRNLVRRFNASRYCADGCVSSLALPFPFVVAGGRFRECYLWDSFWIIKGLLISNMNVTASHVVLNLLHLVDTVGFAPNGARVYYTDRSQPPLLPQMIAEVCGADLTLRPDVCQDIARNPRTIALLESEYFNYWMGSPHLVSGIKGANSNPDGPTPTLYSLNRYYTNVTNPRPESYREDVATAATIQNRSTADVFSDIAAGAETGWDFSTRWFREGLPPNMSAIDTTNVIPVDLNVILFQNERILAKMYASKERYVDAEAMNARANTRLEAIMEVLFVPMECRFADYLLREQRAAPAASMFASSLIPFSEPEIVARIQQTFPGCLDMANINAGLGFNVEVGGIPTSNNPSGQQWDGSNAWAPLQWFAAKAFRTLNATSDLQLLRQRWVSSNYCGFNSTGMMFEKYSAVAPGAAGHGGEYQVQDGFGWTNGVLLDFVTSDPTLTAPQTCT